MTSSGSADDDTTAEFRASIRALRACLVRLHEIAQGWDTREGLAQQIHEAVVESQRLAPDH